jgi:radical SAM protein with 4Fe4S-binding SPASM domain
MVPVEFTGLLYFPGIEKYYAPRAPQELVAELQKRRDGVYFAFSHPVEETNPPVECCIAWMEPYIMMPGYVLPCCAVFMSNRRPFLRKYYFGNVFEKDFKQIWKNEYYTKFRKMVVDPYGPVPKICVGCRAYRTQYRIKKYGIWDIYEQNN